MPSWVPTFIFSVKPAQPDDVEALNDPLWRADFDRLIHDFHEDARITTDVHMLTQGALGKIRAPCKFRDGLRWAIELGIGDNLPLGGRGRGFGCGLRRSL